MPTDEQIKELHKKHAKTEADFNLIYNHCRVIKAIAMQLLDAKPVEDINRDLVHVGCMLHDIGAYEVLINGEWVQGVRHGVIGETILKDEGFPESIWRIASHHTGVGLTAQDVIDQKLPIPPADYTASSDEEFLIMYADKFHSKGIPRPYFCTFEHYRRTISSINPDKAIEFDALAERFGKPDITALAGRFEYDIRDI